MWPPHKQPHNIRGSLFTVLGLSLRCLRRGLPCLFLLSFVYFLVSFGVLVRFAPPTASEFLLPRGIVQDNSVSAIVPRTQKIIQSRQVEEGFSIKDTEHQSFHSCNDLFGRQNIVKKGFCLHHQVLHWMACEVGGEISNRVGSIQPQFIEGSLGGESIIDVLDRAESEEQLKFQKGALLLPAPIREVFPPLFVDGLNPHLRRFLHSASTPPINKAENFFNSAENNSVTLLVRRGNYANPCMAILTIYNVYIVLQYYYNYFGYDPFKKALTVIWLDGHARGDLDSVWQDLFDVDPIHLRQIEHNSSRPIPLAHPMIVNTMSAIGNEGLGLYGWDNEAIKSQCLENSTLVEFRNFVLRRYGLQELHQSMDSGLPKLTLLARKDYLAHPRSTGRTDRVLANVTDEIAYLESQYPGHAIQAVSFEGMPFEEQVKTIASTDILVSVHGAGNIHVLFLPLNATLLEYVPKNFLQRKRFRYLADCLGIKYVQKRTRSEKRRILDPLIVNGKERPTNPNLIQVRLNSRGR